MLTAILFVFSYRRERNISQNMIYLGCLDLFSCHGTYQEVLLFFFLRTNPQLVHAHFTFANTCFVVANKTFNYKFQNV